MMSLLPFFHQNMPVQPEICTPQADVFRPGVTISTTEKIESMIEWHDFLAILRDNLEDAGIAMRKEDFSQTLTWDVARFLYACFLNRTPLMLAGPNGRAIADAFSCARYGTTAALLDCSFSYDPKVVELCVASEDRVIAILNPLNASWVEHIEELASLPDKYVFAVQPFSDDLLIEPKGLYQYFLPLLTELLVEKPPASSFAAGKCEESFLDWHNTDAPADVNGSMLSLRIGGLAERRMKRILLDYIKLSETDHMDTGCLLVLYSYAYLTGQVSKLLERDNLRIGRKAKEYLLALAGEIE